METQDIVAKQAKILAQTTEPYVTLEYSYTFNAEMLKHYTDYPFSLSVDQLCPYCFSESIEDPLAICEFRHLQDMKFYFEEENLWSDHEIHELIRLKRQEKCDFCEIGQRLHKSVYDCEKRYKQCKEIMNYFNLKDKNKSKEEEETVSGVPKKRLCHISDDKTVQACSPLFRPYSLHGSVPLFPAFL